MGLDTFVAKICFAFVFAVILVYVVNVGVSIIGITSCPNCDPFLNAFFFVVVPVAVVFIGIYKVIGVFSRRTT